MTGDPPNWRSTQIDSKRLRVLVEVARQGSISRAASALCFVPSAVSQQIASLERDLGVELTAREGRGIVMTPAGALLAREGEQILEQLSRAELAVRELQESSAGKLAVASFPTAAATLLPTALRKLAEEHPSIEVETIESEPAVSLPRLKRFELDLALTYHYPEVSPAPAAELEEEDLLSDPLLVAVAAEHDAAGLRSAPLERFANDPWIIDVPGSPAHAWLIEACHRCGFHPRAAHRTDDYLVALRMAAAGLGVTLVPAIAVLGLSEQTAIVRIEGDPCRQVAVAVRREGVRAAATSLREALVASAPTWQQALTPWTRQLR